MTALICDVQTALIRQPTGGIYIILLSRFPHQQSSFRMEGTCKFTSGLPRQQTLSLDNNAGEPQTTVCSVREIKHNSTECSKSSPGLVTQTLLPIGLLAQFPTLGGK
ncbi:unnamed protein product [Polarella glacialis]|uniref:Uncharacterized protein n=1 Tax=Polarella glacialis TaxID=89957 RepID=A0A813FDA9_POLGL|nr:unnamed protein product [Polarella glacialis]